MSAPLGPIRFATIACRDIDRSLAAYRAAFGWPDAGAGTVSKALATMWGCPDLSGARWSLLAPRLPGPGGIRLLEVGPETPPEPLTTTGWAAAELSCGDLDAVEQAAVAAGFQVIGAQAPLGSNPAIRAMQVAGPDGEVLYLTDIRAYDGALDLHRATAPVDRVFIAVLAAADLEAARAYYETEFAVTRVSDRAVAVPILRRAQGLGPDATHRISSVQLAGACLLECDQYPTAAKARGEAKGLPLGVAMMTLDGPDDASGRAMPDPPYDGARVRVLTGRAGERLEIVAAEPAKAAA